MSETASNFDFLQSEWPDLFSAAHEAEQQVQAAPRSCLFSCRYALERATRWLYKHDDYLKQAYNDNLGALIHEPTFRENMPPQLFAKVKVIHTSGNLAAQCGKQPAALDAYRCLKELFHFLYWLYRSYSEAEPQEYEFRSDLLKVKDTSKTDHTQEQVLALKKEMEERDKRLEEKEAAHTAALEELAELRKQIQAAKTRNAEIPDTHDYSEVEPRAYIIDLLLREAGWDIEAENVREFSVEGMPGGGTGRVDYALWGDDGKPLAVVEAKRTTVDPKAGRQQAKNYADCLETKYGQRPFIYYTNGYETYFWDDSQYPQRAVQGFHKKTELERLMLRRTQQKPLADVELNREIAGRPYQEEGIRRVTEHFEAKQRKSLVVMATGTGKTRFAIALSDILQKAGWAKRILFLADRNALVRQAKGAFLAHMPNNSPVDIRTARAESQTARVVLSTCVIDEMENGERRFGIGHFDLIIPDEFTEANKNPYIAISVDMLDTGVDVPEALNLVFFKRVYSKVKFHQMIGRGTRTCEDLFAPGEHKKEFLIFDFCENFEFFNNRPKGFVNSAGEPLHQRIFNKRLNLLLDLTNKGDEPGLQEKLRTSLYKTVNGMNLDNFMVRPARKFVERYADLDRWESLSQDDVADIVDQLSELSSDFDEGNAFNRGFDMLILSAQIELLNGDAAFQGRKNALIAIAGKLAEKKSIPQVAKNIDFLEAMQDDEFWESASCGLLEQIRIVLRELGRYLGKDDTQPVYTNFTDTIGKGEETDLPGNPNSLALYRMKVQQYLKAHQDHITIHKLRMNKPITDPDIKELERMLDEAEEVGGKDRLEQAFENGSSLGKLIRGLVGLDRTAAQDAFADFLENGKYNANQIHFVNLIIDHLTQKGTMNPELLFQSPPFTDDYPYGVAGVFPIDAKKLVDCLVGVNGNAVA